MQPFRAILFAADFSENSREAFEMASKLAVEDKTRLFVLHVAEPVWSWDEPVYVGQQPTQFRAQEPDKSRHQALNRKLREVYAPHRSIDVNYQTSEGDAAAEILRKSQEVGSELIVMGTHGLTGLRRLLAGSVAVDVLRGANCPVLALRSGVQPPKGEQIRVIIHPTDFSAGSTAALRVARLLARDQGARLVLLHVAPIQMVLEGAMTAELNVGFLREELENAREIIDGTDLKFPVETRFSRGEPAEVIVRVANEVGCGLIVMGTRGRTGLGRLLLGNTAESVLPEASCPVMIVKASAPIPSTPSNQPVATHAANVE